MLILLPISIHYEDLSCSNSWLIPILRDYVVGSSLEYYMDHIVPLAKSFQLASRKGISSAYIVYFMISFCCYVTSMILVDMWKSLSEGL